MRDLNEDNHLTAGWNFNNSYIQLPQLFYVRQKPVAVIKPQIVKLNKALAESLGLDPNILKNELNQNVFSGNKLPQASDPISQAYAGHQFGNFNILGDGRAVLLGEHITPAGIRYDIQLKGSGITAYSRRGDGRAALGPMLREYIISEAMHALNIPTTRSLAVMKTGESVYRDRELSGAILTRVASSHIRVGTFQFAAIQPDQFAIKELADYTLNRHFPDFVSAENKYHYLLNTVIDKQSALIASWMHIGFIHGVMNTDNMSISGETIDYGPCAFMDAYDPETTFSSIDQYGRYAFGNQANIAQWNLARFAETLLPLLHKDLNQSINMATESIKEFAIKFQNNWLSGMRAKLGLFMEKPDDLKLVEDLLICMKNNKMDYANTFRDLATQSHIDKPMTDIPEFIRWHSRWRDKILNQNKDLKIIIKLMLKSNPVVIPRNHQVENALSAAESGNFSIFENLMEALSKPYEVNPLLEHYRLPPSPSKIPYKTFCGT